MTLRLSSVALLFIVPLLSIDFLCAFAGEDCSLSLLQTGASLQQRPGQVGSDFFEIADPSLEAAARAEQSKRRVSAASVENLVAPFDVGSNAVPLPHGIIVSEPKFTSNLISLAEVSSPQAEEQQVTSGLPEEAGQPRTTPEKQEAELQPSEAPEHPQVLVEQADAPPAASLQVLESEPPLPLASEFAKAPQSQEVLESLLTQQRKVANQDFEDNENPADFVEHEANVGAAVNTQLGTATAAAKKADALKLAATEKAAASWAAAAERKAVARAAVEKAVAEKAAARVAAENAAAREALRFWRRNHASPHHHAQRQQLAWRRNQASFDQTMKRLEEDEKRLLTALQSKQDLQADGLESSRKSGCGPDDDGNDSSNPC